jgi:hypothetical protein
VYRTSLTFRRNILPSSSGHTEETTGLSLKMTAAPHNSMAQNTVAVNTHRFIDASLFCSPVFPFLLSAYDLHIGLRARSKRVAFLVHTIFGHRGTCGSIRTDATWLSRWMPTFRRNLLLPCSSNNREQWIASATTSIVVAAGSSEMSTPICTASYLDTGV